MRLLLDEGGRSGYLESSGVSYDGNRHTNCRGRNWCYARSYPGRTDAVVDRSDSGIKGAALENSGSWDGPPFRPVVPWITWWWSAGVCPVRAGLGSRVGKVLRRLIAGPEILWSPAGKTRNEVLAWHNSEPAGFKSEKGAVATMVPRVGRRRGGLKKWGTAAARDMRRTNRRLVSFFAVWSYRRREDTSPVSGICRSIV